MLHIVSSLISRHSSFRTLKLKCEIIEFSEFLLDTSLRGTMAMCGQDMTSIGWNLLCLLHYLSHLN